MPGSPGPAGISDGVGLDGGGPPSSDIFDGRGAATGRPCSTAGIDGLDGVASVVVRIDEGAYSMGAPVSVGTWVSASISTGASGSKRAGRTGRSDGASPRACASSVPR